MANVSIEGKSEPSQIIVTSQNGSFDTDQRALVILVITERRYERWRVRRCVSKNVSHLNVPEENLALSGPLKTETSELPAEPILTIESARRWIGLDLHEVWAHRDLFYFLVLRDIKIRYKQTALGVAWAVLQPVLTMVVFTAIFGRLAGVPSDGKPYPIFVFAGLLPWNFFNQAVTNSSNSLVGNAALITKVYFPRLVIPSAAVGAGLIDFAIGSVLLFMMAFYYGVAFSVWILMMVPLALLTTLFAISVGMWMSALNVKYRDVRYALPFLLQIWMYVTPIIYPVTFIPARWRWLIVLNPLSGVIQGFRCAIFAQPFDWNAIAVSAGVTFLVLICAAFVFRRMEREFADII